MKITAVRMSKAGWLPKLVSKLYLQRDRILVFLAAFLIAGSNISGAVPLGAAYYAASRGAEVPWLLTGAAVILGTLFHGSFELVFINAACMILFSILSIPLKSSNTKMNVRAAFAAFISALAPQLVLSGIWGFLLYDILKSIFCSFIVFVFYFIFRFSIPVISGIVRKAVLDGEEAVSAGITAALAVSGFGSLQLFGFSLRNILCTLMVLFFSYKCSAGAGAATGAAAGLIISASSGATPSTAGAFALCGMLAGILGSLGKAGSALGFILGNMILAVYFNGTVESMLYLRDVLAASLIFFIVPEKLADRFTAPFARRSAQLSNRKNYSRRIRDLTAERLRKFAGAFMAISRTFGETAGNSAASEKHDINVLFDRVADRICRDCSLCLHCWERSFYDTYQVMFRIVESLEARGRVEESDIPSHFIDRCPRINDFVNAVNNMYELFKVGVVWKSRIGESRSVLSRQFEGMSRVIGNLAEEIDTDISFIEPLEDTISAALKQEGIRAGEVTAYRGLWGKYEITIHHSPCGGARKCTEVADRIVSEAAGRRMVRSDGSCPEYGCAECTLKYIEAENLRLTTGVARMPKHGSRVSGDSFSFMEGNNGKYTLALSDGMGSGYGASAQSKAAVDMLESFLESGFDKDMAVNLINSVLVLKSDEDSTCTMDIAMIDLFSGEVEFIKIGAAPTYIKKDSRVEIIRSASLPAGILPGVDAELSRKAMDAGDMIIMVTDGVIDSMAGDEPGDRALLKYIRRLESLNPQSVAESILEEAARGCDGQPFDDMTVLVAKVWEKPL
jgi:stage II sporulation protein E